MLNLLDTLGARQYGVAHRDQLRERGIKNRTIDQWANDGRLIRVHPSTFRLQGAPETWRGNLLASVLAAGEGAAASHRSSGRLWGIHDTDVIEISVPRGRCPKLDGVVVHRSRDLQHEHILRRARIPTTSPMRAVAECTSVLPLEDVLDMAGAGIGKRLFSHPTLERVYERLATGRRPGINALKEVLDELALLEAPPDSVLEIRMHRLLRRYDLPGFVFQYWVVEGEIRVDFANPELKIFLEVDGFGSRSNPMRLSRELERQNTLIAMGWRPVRFTWWMVVKRPEYVASMIRTVVGGD